MGPLPFAGNFDHADDRVAEVLDPGVVQPDVVRGPAGAELRAAGGKFTDEAGQVAVQRVAVGFGAQQCAPAADAVRPAPAAGRSACTTGRLPARTISPIRTITSGAAVPKSTMHVGGSLLPWDRRASPARTIGSSAT
jgi:hypothetical protein